MLADVRLEQWALTQTAGCSLAAVTSPLPNVVVVVVDGCLHLTAARVAGRGRGFEVWHQRFLKLLGFGVSTKPEQIGPLKLVHPLRSVFEKSAISVCTVSAKAQRPSQIFVRFQGNLSFV